MANIFQLLPSLEGDEMIYVQGITKDMTDAQLQFFATLYSARRKDPLLILLTALLGFAILAPTILIALVLIRRQGLIPDGLRVP